jgi:hypothetical protein
MRHDPWLPQSLPPRGLSRSQAAEYVGVGVTKFDEMVGDRRMPKAKRIDRRLIWDRRELDEAFDRIDQSAEWPPEGTNLWDEVLV